MTLPLVYEYLNHTNRYTAQLNSLLKLSSAQHLRLFIWSLFVTIFMTDPHFGKRLYFHLQWRGYEKNHTLFSH